MPTSGINFHKFGTWPDFPGSATQLAVAERRISFTRNPQLYLRALVDPDSETLKRLASNLPVEHTAWNPDSFLLF